MTATIEIYTRTDGKHAWRLIAPNGSIIATDGGQGYENKSDCERMARYVANGKYRRAKIKTLNDGRRTKKQQTPPPPPTPPTTKGAR